MIRGCTDADVAAIETVVNDAAQIYRDVIPADCWHEPYMSRSDLLAEIDAGATCKIGAARRAKRLFPDEPLVLPAQQPRQLGKFAAMRDYWVGSLTAYGTLRLRGSFL
jgi:hypothetical protein